MLLVLQIFVAQYFREFRDLTSDHENLFLVYTCLIPYAFCFYVATPTIVLI